MANQTEKKDKNIYVLSKDPSGTVVVTENVVALIAAYAATDVDGVSDMASGATKELLAKAGISNLANGIKVTIAGDEINIDAAISVEYGASIPKVSAAVQDKIKASVENMTGLNVTSVNIRIANVEVER